MTDAQVTGLAAPDSTNPAGPPRMTMQEAADYLKVPYTTLAQKWRTWGIPSYKIGRERRFYQHELDAWARGRREVGFAPLEKISV